MSTPLELPPGPLARFRPGMRSARIDFTGDAPLLMKAPTLLDPFHPITREIRALTARTGSKRTADEDVQIARWEWLGSLYHDADAGPYVPRAMVKAALRDAARRWKLGATVERSLVVLDRIVPLIYDGPRDPDGLWDAGYRDVRAVKNAGLNGGRVPRCRPCFAEWAITFTVAFDPVELDLERVERAAHRAEWSGIGDYRPEFGTFVATVTDLGGCAVPE